MSTIWKVTSSKALPLPLKSWELFAKALEHMGCLMSNVYKVVELVGSSEKSIEDAIEIAIKRAGQTVRNLRWFEVVQTRGRIERGGVKDYQVVLKAGFALDGGNS